MSTPAFPPSFPPGRYGRRRRPTRPPKWVLPVLIGLVVAATSTLAFAAYRRQSSEVIASVRSYEVSAANVRVTFEVRKPGNESATCILRARDSAGAVVGQSRVPVPAIPTRVTLTRTVPTTARAVTGEVLGCSLDND